LLGLDNQNPHFSRFVELVENLLTAPDFPIFYEGHEELKKLSVELLADKRLAVYSRLKLQDDVEPRKS